MKNGSSFTLSAITSFLLFFVSRSARRTVVVKAMKQETKVRATSEKMLFVKLLERTVFQSFRSPFPLARCIRVHGLVFDDGISQNTLR